MLDKFGRDITEIEGGWRCDDPIDGSSFTVGGIPYERAIDTIENMWTAQCFLWQALEELPDSPEGMEDPVLLVGGPLADQVIDWPAPTNWQTVRSWFGASDRRTFEYGSQSVTYRRDGGTASCVS
jgi:hypothetical protein